MNMDFLQIDLIRFPILIVIVFIFIRFLRKCFDRLAQQVDYFYEFKGAFPFIEISIWIFFIFWLLNQVFTNAIFYNLGIATFVILMIGYIFWFYFKDVIAGLLLRTDFNYSVNDLIQFKEHQGRIIRLGLKSIELELKNGENLRIPYSVFSNQTVIRLNSLEISKGMTFQFSTVKTDSTYHLIEEIKSVVFNSPWVDYKKVPQVKLISEEETHFKFEILVYLYSLSHIRDIKSTLEEQVN